jgi:acyl-coenzyme A thioesterase PaaI-like protein
MAEPQARTAPVAADRPRPSGGPGERIRRAWDRLSPLPGGRWLFSRLVDWMAPYTGSIRARVHQLGPGYARITLRERRALRNPFRSVHAVALMNLAEEASGLATLYALPDGVRGIITKLECEYLKKARGTITAECKTAPPSHVPAEPLPHVAEVTLSDENGQVVALAKATWTLAGAR